MKHPEQDTVKAILQFLHAHRIPAWRVNSGAFRAEYKGRIRFHRFGAVGMSDILGLDPRKAGQLVAIEVKSPLGRGQVSRQQQAFLDQVTAAGGKAFIARDVATVARELGLG
jgi:hypothetical protein